MTTSGFCNPCYPITVPKGRYNPHTQCKSSTCTCECHTPSDVEAPPEPLPLVEAGDESGPSASTSEQPLVMEVGAVWQIPRSGVLTDEERAALVENRGPMLAELAQAVVEKRREYADDYDVDPVCGGWVDALDWVVRAIMYGIPRQQLIDAPPDGQ